MDFENIAFLWKMHRRNREYIQNALGREFVGSRETASLRLEAFLRVGLVLAFVEASPKVVEAAYDDIMGEFA